MRMPKAIRNAYENLPMPMRVDGASALTRLMRLSIQRAIHTLTTTKTVTVANAFSTDQIVIRVAPFESPIESSCVDDRIEEAEQLRRDQGPTRSASREVPRP